MTTLAEWLAWKINRLFPALTNHKEQMAAMQSTSANQKWAYQEIQRIVFAFEPFFDLKNKLVMDIGSGMGGKLPFFIQCGAKKVIGIDVDINKTIVAHEHIITDKHADTIQILAADAATLPFANDLFDAIISINTFEHVSNVDLCLKESYRVLKPGGQAYIFLPPYYSPWGPHLEYWIRFPWPHLLFSEKTLMWVAAKEDDRININETFIDGARINWQIAGDCVPNVNRVTLRKFRQLVKQVGFETVNLRLLPPGYRRMNSSKSTLGKTINHLLTLTTRIPILQEAIVTKMAYVLQKTKN